MIRKGFNKIFYGMIFVLLSINISGVDILPAFIGYIFFISAYENLKNESVYFKKSRKFLWVLLIITIIMFYRTAFIGIDLLDTDKLPQEFALALITVFLTLLNFYNMFKGIKEMAIAKGYNEIAQEAGKRWKQIVLLNILTLLFIVIIFVPVLNIAYLLAIAVLSIIITVKIMKMIRKCANTLGEK